LNSSGRRAFAKLKRPLRTTTTRPVPDLREAIRRACANFTPQECRNALAAAGYEDDVAVAA
jgi:hypothetical protein